MSDAISWLNGLPDTDKVALIALSGVLITAAITFISSRRSVYINSITTERSKWINELRVNISEFSKYLLTVHFKKGAGQLPLDEADSVAAVQRLNGLIALIKLQLNPDGEIDANIIKILDIFSHSNLDRTIVEHTLDLLIAHSQWLLKAEWERVKYEASGFVGRGFILYRLKIHEGRYRDFCLGQGKMP